MVTLVTNIYLSCTLYINMCSLMWCYSEHSVQRNLLVVWLYNCSRSVNLCFESISYICCSFWRPTEWSTADICFGLTRYMKIYEDSYEERKGHVIVTTVSVMVICSKQIHRTILSALLKFVSVDLFNNRHFPVRIPNARPTHLLARDSPQFVNMLFTWQGPFSLKASLGKSLEDRPYHQG